MNIGLIGVLKLHAVMQFIRNLTRYLNKTVPFENIHFQSVTISDSLLLSTNDVFQGPGIDLVSSDMSHEKYHFFAIDTNIITVHRQAILLLVVESGTRKFCAFPWNFVRGIRDL